uniref:hypothetical protein n=1 Tax=Streptomyces sp. SID7805 TaxID=2690328 RepID=UPI001F04C052|nr:hypothetical protein [Streptomyces sp. SID7805]
MAWHDFAARGPVARNAGDRIAGRRGRSGPGRWTAAALVGGLWWWAVLRLTLWPHSAGVIEGAVAAGGWGLSLLPVHCVPWVGRDAETAAVVRRGRAALTTAWRRRRSGGGSGRS